MTDAEVLTALQTSGPLTEQVTLACTLYGEARGEPLRGLVAVWNVIANRVAADLGADRQPDWWGEGITAVCLKPAQFSCWWQDGPNKMAVMSLAAQLLLNPTVMLHPKIELVRRIAELAREGVFADLTGGANHYCTTATVDQTFWARGRTPSAIIGAHSFFVL